MAGGRLALLEALEAELAAEAGGAPGPGAPGAGAGAGAGAGDRSSTSAIQMPMVTQLVR